MSSNKQVDTAERESRKGRSDWARRASDLGLEKFLDSRDHEWDEPEKRERERSRQKERECNRGTARP